MKAAFWRYAHQRYHVRKPTPLADAAAFGWGFFFMLVYGTALIAGWRPDGAEAITGTLLIGIPLGFGLLHRRIRIEAAKAPDALYRKRIETDY